MTSRNSSSHNNRRWRINVFARIYFTTSTIKFTLIDMQYVCMRVCEHGWVGVCVCACKRERVCGVYVYMLESMNVSVCASACVCLRVQKLHLWRKKVFFSNIFLSSIKPLTRDKSSHLTHPLITWWMQADHSTMTLSTLLLLLALPLNTVKL